MSRWHQASCQTPVVIVENQILRCRNCGSSIDLPALIEEHANLTLPWETVPNEPWGEMNLSWPSSVPYQPSQESKPNSAARDLLHKRGEPGADSGLAESNPSAVYNSSLGKDQFRLINLPAPCNADDLIWISLETHELDPHPDYETCSYTWSSEGDHVVATKPIYVGPYFDVLLLEQNCWSMMRYLRPSRGFRLVWIDAICINQQDKQDRAMQVAAMGRIYRQSLRAVLYLGEDIVKQTWPRYRRRKDFHQLAEDSTLSNILARKYFRRIWVIQELILAPSIIIPYQKADYIAGWQTVSRLNSAYNFKWEATEMPWMAKICQDTLPSEDLYDVLDLTWGSQATDARDKFYGVLGLVEGKPNSQELVPNYSISFHHCLVGIMAHLLINENRWAILRNANCQNHPGPSWLPNFNGRDTFKDIGQLSDTTLRAISSEWGNLCKNQIKMFPPVIYNADGKHHNLELPSQLHNSVFVRSSSGALSIKLHHLFTARVEQISTQPKKVGGTVFHCHKVRYKGYHVKFLTDSFDTDLSLSEKPLTIFFVEESEFRCLLFFMHKTGDDTYKLFSCSWCYFIHLQINGPIESALCDWVTWNSWANATGYQEGYYCPFYDANPQILVLDTAIQQARRIIYRHWFVNERESRNSDIDQKSISKANALPYTSTGYNYGELYMYMFPDLSSTLLDVLEFFQMYLHEIRRMSQAGYERDDVYEALFKQNTKNKRYWFEDGGIYIATNSEDWGHLYDHLQVSGLQTSGVKYRFVRSLYHVTMTSRIVSGLRPNERPTKELVEGFQGASSWADFHSMLNFHQRKFADFEICLLHINIVSFMRALSKTAYFNALKLLTPAVDITKEDELTMLLRGPRSGDELIELDVWPQAIKDAFNIDGRTRRVWIE
jgi:hypothetical protein